MKKEIFVGILLLALTSSIPGNAEMKITPSGISSPNDSGEIHLNGSPFYAFGGPLGAVISGFNNYSGTNPSYGGYFAASSITGHGVYGSAPAYGGYFKATHQYGSAVYGISAFRGGSFEAKGGDAGTAVYGYAYTNEGASGNNFGGYFGAESNADIGGIGVEAWGGGENGIGVRAYGGKWDFYAESGKIGYGPFTGAHEVKFAQDIQEEISPGMIVSVTGKAEVRMDKNDEIALSSTMPTVKVSSKSNDKAVFGVILTESPLPDDHWYQAEEGDRFGVVNALGEGRVWVTNRNGAIEAGDYVTTSDVPGYGQLQDDDLLHSYTLGKAIETIDWKQVSETVQYEGRTYKRYLLAVVYTSG